MKEYLSQKGIPYAERDVTSDRAAAQEMYRLTGQLGVPVTTVDGATVVGFDKAGLDQVLSQAGPAQAPARPSFGLKIGDARTVLAKRGQEPVDGAYVAGTAPNSPAARAGLRAGDIVVEFNGRTISNAADLEKAVEAADPRSRASLTVQRSGITVRTEANL